MDMIRWLATNKVVLAVWGLGILAMVLAALFGGSEEPVHETAVVETKVVETTAGVTKPAVTTLAATAVVTAAVTATESNDAPTEVQTAVTSAASVPDADTATSEAQAETVVSAESESDDLSGKSSDDLLMMAREAYWDNGLDKAASLYSELIVREPTVIEHKGELGNVFWRQGYPKKAAELYAGIAEPMIAKGNGERVSNMVGFIGLFFPERATNIRALLDAQ